MRTVWWCQSVPASGVCGAQFFADISCHKSSKQNWPHWSCCAPSCETEACWIAWTFHCSRGRCRRIFFQRNECTSDVEDRDSWWSSTGTIRMCRAFQAEFSREFSERAHALLASLSIVYRTEDTCEILAFPACANWDDVPCSAGLWGKSGTHSVPHGFSCDFWDSH